MIHFRTVYVLLLLIIIIFILKLNKMTQKVKEEFLTGSDFEECLERETKITPMRLASDIIKYCKSL
tara:strand:+ start:332 stop:529 length:198 start_codon:yes stop_codon:yes gene_type:complete